MLFYNSKKEFVGIDAEELNSLGFNNLSELMSESADFADLFVRTPGFIHNFKYVHWIDYIMYGGSSDIPKAIIHTKAKNYWCNIDITTSYMSDEPATPAYIINLINLRELSQEEIENITADIDAKPTPYALDIEEAPYIHPSVRENIQKSIEKQNQSFENRSQILEQEEETKTVITSSEKSEIQTQIPIENISVNTVEETPQTIDSAKTEEIKEEKEIITEDIQDTTSENENDLGYDTNYLFDAQVASDELGLPLDLIEEFIEDFIIQAKEFKDELYRYLDEEDINNVRILSHKLKGVAANLRVEDAFQILTTINTSDDLVVIRKNLEYFYIVIAKLNGEEPINIVEEISTKDKDEFVLDFKDDDITETVDNSNTTIEKTASIEYSDDIPLEISLNDEIIEETSSNQPENILNENITLDTEKIIQELGIDVTDFKELLSDYTTDALDICTQINQSIVSNSQKNLNKQVTKLKGMSENMKTYHLIANEIETLLENPQQSVAQNAIDTITHVISNIKV